MELFIAIQIDIVIQTIRVENEPLFTSEYVVSTSSTFDNWIYEARKASLMTTFRFTLEMKKNIFMLSHNNTITATTAVLIFADDDYGGSGMAQAMEE